MFIPVISFLIIGKRSSVLSGHLPRSSLSQCLDIRTPEEASDIHPCVVHLRAVQSFEAVLVNGSLTIVDFRRVCEISGFEGGLPKKIEGDTFTASITSLEIDSLFDVILETCCPYLGYYRNNKTSKIDSTETLTDIKPTESFKVNNASEPYKLGSKSTMIYSTLKENSTDTTTKPDIVPLLDITTNATTMLLKTEPTVESKESTPHITAKISFTVENATESIKSSLKLISDSADTNITSTSDDLPITDISTKTTVGLPDSASTTKGMENTTNMKPKLLFIVKNVTDVMIPLIKTDITSKIEVVSTTEITEEETTMSGHSKTNSKSSCSYEHKNETSTTKLLPETISSTSTIVPLTDVIDTTDVESTESNKMDITKDITTTAQILFTKKKATNLVKNLKSTTPREEKVSSAPTLMTKTTSIYEEIDFFTISSPLSPVVNYNTIDIDKVDSPTDDYVDVGLNYVNSTEPSTLMNTSDDVDPITDYNSTKDTTSSIGNATSGDTDDDNESYDDDDSDDDESDEPKEPALNTNGTLIYKHDIKSVDERRIVIVILFVSILLALIVIWISKVLYRKRSGKYVLPQNLNNEDIELGENSE